MFIKMTDNYIKGQTGKQWGHDDIGVWASKVRDYQWEIYE